MSPTMTPSPNAPRRDFLGIARRGQRRGVRSGRRLSARALRRAAGAPAFAAPTVVGKLEDFPLGTGEDRPRRRATRPRHPHAPTASSERSLRSARTCSASSATSPERNQIECPCHHGVYSIDGQNIAGPPPRPLDELTVTINDGRSS